MIIQTWLAAAAPSFALATTLPHQQPDHLGQLIHWLDRDADGRVARYEAAEALMWLIDEADRDNDQALSRHELIGFLHDDAKDVQVELDEIFQDLDSDNDGSLTKFTLPAEFRPLLDRADADRDGTISRDDLDDIRLDDPSLFIDMELARLADELDANADGTLTLAELPRDLREEFADLDDDKNGELSPDELALLFEADTEGATFTPRGSTAVMSGVIGATTPARLLELALEHPDIDTIVMLDVPGSMDDEANLRAARLARQLGLKTHLSATSEIASGGTDFFLAGVSRTAEPGALIGVHSWGGFGQEGADVPRDHPEHERYLSYYRQIDIPEDFYWYTLDAAPVDDIHWMTEEEIARYNILTRTSLDSDDAQPPSTKRKRLEVHGIPIIAAPDVDDQYLYIAALVYSHMTSRSDLLDIRAAHRDSGFKIILISPEGRFRDMPEYAGQEADIEHAGGLGGLIGEFYIGVRVGSPHILIHELAHGIYHSAIQFRETGGADDEEAWYRQRVRAVHDRDLDDAMDQLGPEVVHEVLLAPEGTFSADLAAAWRNASDNGIWADEYAGTEPNEYWAEGVSLWFRAWRPDDTDPREYLRRRDPTLYALIERVFPNTAWSPEQAVLVSPDSVTFDDPEDDGDDPAALAHELESLAAEDLQEAIEAIREVQIPEFELAEALPLLRAVHDHLEHADLRQALANKIRELEQRP